MDITSSCSSGRERLGLSFTIDYLLFNKGSRGSREEAVTQRPTAHLAPQGTAKDQSPKNPADRVNLKPETPEGESERSEEENEEGEGKEDGEKESSSSENPQDKPTQSYIALISMAILASEEKKLLLCDIYQWIMDHYPYFKNKDKNWKNSVRHNLSLNECFIKAGRSDNGKGHFWAIHPANIQDFSKGDYHRRRARRRIRSVTGQLPYPFPTLYPAVHRPRSVQCWCCPPAHQPIGHPARIYWSWATLPVHRAPTLHSFI
ncbi:forkhead box Q2-like [Scleropages formosus]|uniref:Forkhead box Q2-like n=1 Tax=Scleropages formosus TaxID=113540 RepID=A0A0P7U513_SCLFO|nr:forkhead box protein L2-like [Scleropages formosus]KPP69236.1 forkhead box Q2-like [Scleropages formosus]